MFMLSAVLVTLRFEWIASIRVISLPITRTPGHSVNNRTVEQLPLVALRLPPAGCTFTAMFVG